MHDLKGGRWRFIDKSGKEIGRVTLWRGDGRQV
jgi:hypothetical protein